MTAGNGPDRADATEGDRAWGRRTGATLDLTLRGFESLIYGVVGLLLAAAGVFVVVGTVEAARAALSEGQDAIEIGILLLDRVLLTLIVAELTYTLRFVIQTREIAAEPFVFIGLIATVRRILIVTAEFEQPTSPRELTNLLLELGLLGFLALGLAAAVFLIRRSAKRQ